MQSCYFGHKTNCFSDVVVVVVPNISATTNPHLLSLFNRLDIIGAICIYALSL